MPDNGNDSALFGGSVDRSKLEEMKAAAGDDPVRQAQVAEVQAQVDAVAESDAAAEKAREDALAAQNVQQAEADKRQAAPAAQPAQAEQTEDTKALQAEAEAAGVTVDKRWGADRLRQELASAQSAKRKER